MTARLSRRAALTTIDQAFSSASNVAVGLAVARISGPSGLGAYALAYAVWLVVAGVHRSLVTDAMIIDGSFKRNNDSARLGAGLAAALSIGLLATALIVTTGAVVFSSGARTLGTGLLGVAPWIVFLVVQDYWRWIGFMQGTPGKSLANDVFFVVVQATAYTGIVLAGNRSPVGALAAWGAGALFGSAFGCWQFAVDRTALHVRRHFNDTWRTSKWLLAENLSGWLSSQAYVITIGVVLGPVGLGAFRAAQTLTGPLGVLLQLSGSIGLPEAARGFQEEGLLGLRRVCRLVTLVGVISASAFGAVIFVASDTLMVRAFGREFGQYGDIAVLMSAANILGAFSLGTLLSLKVRGLSQSLFRIRCVSGFISIASVVILSPSLGLATAGWAVVVTTVANVSGLVYHARRAVARGGVGTRAPA